MQYNYEKLLNEARDFKNAHPEMDDLTLFFEFGTLDLLEDYDKRNWGVIVKELLKKFSFDEEGVCSVILYDILKTAKLSKKQWDSIFNALKQSWQAKQNKKGK